jgi:hypothetical protein
MKRARSTKSANIDPVEKRRDWSYFSGFAKMHVWNSGGPIHAPHERVLQLLIRRWHDDHQSWTVYRHKAGAGKDGKVVFKRWNRTADLERVRSLGGKKIPKEWHETESVIEKQCMLPGRWVAALERAVGALAVPPTAGPVRPLPRDTEYQLSFWRSRQESRFSWNPTPPAAWRPLARLFSSLLRNFRQHADGKPLPPVHELQPEGVSGGRKN